MESYLSGLQISASEEWLGECMYVDRFPCLHVYVMQCVCVCCVCVKLRRVSIVGGLFVRS